MILSGQSIRARCANPDYITTYPMVGPFTERTVEHGMSFGLSVAGYDVRIREKFVLKPGEFKLASTIEHFHMPTDVIGLVHDKSTWARRGLSLLNTVIEPGWKGYLTLELMNFSDDLLEFKHGMPIAQILFLKTDQPCEKPYSGKYDHAPEGVTPALLERPAAQVLSFPTSQGVENERELVPA